jgi:spore coat polysaccharide biosynthesis predicted glycosyltransferase SpsG
MWSVVVRCDASSAIGFGHLVRSLALARELADRDARVSFAITEAPEAIALVKREGFHVARTGRQAAAVWDALAAVPRKQMDALVLDVRDDAPRARVDGLRARQVLVATIDDPTERRLSADLVFYPPIPQVEAFDWRGFAGTRLVGGEWVVLRRAFGEPPVRAVRARPTVLITMGGSDPAGMTLTAVDAVTRMSEAFHLIVVLGPGYRDRDRLDARLARVGRPVMIEEAPSNMRGVMLNADVAIASFGVTAYELAATATPAAHFCLTADHARSASGLETAGAAVVLGVHTGGEAPRAAETLASLLADPEGRSSMGRAGRALIDGRGAARVADRIVAELEARNSRADKKA